MIGIEIRIGLGKNRNTLCISKEIFIKIMHGTACSDTICQHLHLATTDTRRDIGHAVVIPNMGVLVMWSIITCLCRQENSFVFIFVSMAHDGSATRCGNNFIAVETQHTKAAKSSTGLAFVGRA